ncbi:MAG: hemerythrin domain-containing protein [Pseudomonadota bacterium]
MTAARGARLSEVVKSLREDHRNFAVLIELVSAEAASARSGGEPDFELLADIMHYMCGYSDVVHHPTEDIVYALLADAGGEYCEGLERVEAEHRELALASQQLKDACDAAKSGAVLLRERFVDETQKYVERLGRHIAWEEHELFPRAERLASSTIDVTAVAADDPLFGPRPDSTFSRLLVRLREEAAQR